MNHFADTTYYLLSGFSMGWRWSSSLVVYPPKKVGAKETAVDRAPKDTRPISLKLTSAKVITAAFNFSWRAALPAWAPSSQRGFVAGRQLSHNVVLADVAARTLGFTAKPGDLPVGVSTDLESAFPLVARRWLLQSFRSAGADSGSMNFLTSVHQDTWAVRWHGDQLSFEYLMWSGILQGCPLAGFCYIVLFAPTLWMMTESLTANDGTFACADDVLLTLGSIARLPLVHRAFELTKAASCLRLNLGKCFLVPLFSGCSAFAKELLRDAVVKFCPSWARVSVVGHTPYLGTPFGPDATIDLWWRDPLAKFCFRCAQIRASHSCPTLSGSLMSARAVSCLAYIAQYQLPRRPWACWKHTKLPPSSMHLGDRSVATWLHV